MTLPGTPINSLPGCSLEPIRHTNTPIMCILGCLLTDVGKQIKNELQSWLTTKYDVIAVNQEPPGVYFEFPALAFARQYSIQYNKPVLYIHTKGAANPTMGYNQQNIRHIWRYEFCHRYNNYHDLIMNNEFDVVCPFTGASKITWFNGFIASPSAWKSIQVVPSTNRYIYERLFVNSDVRIFGCVMNDITDEPPSTDVERMINFVNTPLFNQ